MALAARDGAVHLHVTDEGPGIPQEHRRNVFERFYRVGGTETDGSGLGLAIVAEIVNAHGGTVGIVDRTEGCGIIVQVTLPAAERA